MLDTLTEHNVKINCRYEQKLQPIYLSCRDGFGDCIVTLVKAGANIDSQVTAG